MNDIFESAINTATYPREENFFLHARSSSNGGEVATDKRNGQLVLQEHFNFCEV